MSWIEFIQTWMIFILIIWLAKIAVDAIGAHADRKIQHEHQRLVFENAVLEQENNKMNVTIKVLRKVYDNFFSDKEDFT